MKRIIILFVVLLISVNAMAQCDFLRTVSAGGEHALGIRSDGTLWTWGGNYNGQLGNGTSVNSNSPIMIDTATDWQFVSGGNSHCLAIKNGSLWAWGRNLSYQLGDGTFFQRNVPTLIGSDTNWAVVSAGGMHSMGLKKDGTLWAWGSNASGQLGDGTNSNRTVPTQIGTATNWKIISAGNAHNMAIKTDGSLWVWGENFNGELGVGNTTDLYTPTQIGIGNTWQDVSAGYEHSLAVQTNGNLWSWGENNGGQLGDSTTSDKLLPTLISTSNNWKHVSAGDEHSMGMQIDGTIYTWGRNQFGQLGDGTNASRLVPTKIIGLNNFNKISASVFSFNFALKNDGSLWAWGSNFSGELGDSSVIGSNTPKFIKDVGIYGINNTIALASTNNATSVYNTNTTATVAHDDGLSIPYTTSNCEIICDIQDAVGGNTLGIVTAKVITTDTAYVVGNQPASLRYYEINPTSSGPVNATIYQTQDDFNRYNSLNTVSNGTWDKLPTSGIDAAGIARVRVTQNNSSGGSAIIPNATWWDGLNNRWTINFTTSQFGNFYVHTANPSNAPLNLTENFYATRVISSYPNPVYDRLHIQLQSSNHPVVIKLVDITGRAVITKQSMGVNELQLEVGKLSNGIYHLVVFESDSVIYRTKILKQ